MPLGRFLGCSTPPVLSLIRLAQRSAPCPHRGLDELHEQEDEADDEVAGGKPRLVGDKKQVRRRYEVHDDDGAQHRFGRAPTVAARARVVRERPRRQPARQGGAEDERARDDDQPRNDIHGSLTPVLHEAISAQRRVQLAYHGVRADAACSCPDLLAATGSPPAGRGGCY